MVDRRKGYPLKETLQFRFTFFMIVSTLVLLILLAFILSLFSQWLLIKRGFVVLGNVGTFFSDAIQNALVSLLIVIAVFIITVYFIVLYIAKRFTGPIMRMNSHVKGLANGEVKEPLKFRHYDEPVLHSIADGINLLARRLERYESLLKEALSLIEKCEGENREILERIKKEIKD